MKKQGMNHKFTPGFLARLKTGSVTTGVSQIRILEDGADRYIKLLMEQKVGSVDEG